MRRYEPHAQEAIERKNDRGTRGFIGGFHGDRSCRGGNNGRQRAVEVLPEDGSATITGYTEEPSSHLEIPSELDGYVVIGIGDSVFFECFKLTSVNIPDSVTSIGEDVLLDPKKHVRIRQRLQYKGGRANDNFDMIKPCLFSCFPNVFSALDVRLLVLYTKF